MSSSTENSRGCELPLAIIGGSGLDDFPELSIVARERSRTPYGYPSDDIATAERGGRRIFFLPRHGKRHVFPPHRIPYQANIAALRELGACHAVASCVAGSLKQEILPGTFVVPDQFVNLTWGRDAKWEEGEPFRHLPMGDPYCASMRQLLLSAAREEGVDARDGGTIAVIQGPRFSTKAESKWLAGNGWDVVNMTQYPECYFARESGMCYAALVAVTDYDVGLPSPLSMTPQGIEMVLGLFRENVRLTRRILLRAADLADNYTGCRCAQATALEYFERAE